MDQEMIWSPSKQNTKILRNLPDSHALHMYMHINSLQNII